MKHGDCISRQAAIAEFSCCELTPDGGIDANYAIQFLEQMPSADVRENVRGEWEQVVSGGAILIRCNQCKNAISENDFFEICRKVNHGSKLLDFCPNCGADMRGSRY